MAARTCRCDTDAGHGTVRVPPIPFPCPDNRNAHVFHTQTWFYTLSSSPAAVPALAGAGQCNPFFSGWVNQRACWLTLRPALFVFK